mgnify:CR=1 FL=1
MTSGIRSAAPCDRLWQVAAVVGLRTSQTDEVLLAAGCTSTVADWSELTEARLRALVAR